MGKFKRALQRLVGGGKRRERRNNGLGGGDESGEVTESNSEVQGQVSRNGPTTTSTSTPTLDLVSSAGVDEDRDVDELSEEDSGEVSLSSPEEYSGEELTEEDSGEVSLSSPEEDEGEELTEDDSGEVSVSSPEEDDDEELTEEDSGEMSWSSPEEDDEELTEDDSGEMSWSSPEEDDEELTEEVSGEMSWSAPEEESGEGPGGEPSGTSSEVAPEEEGQGPDNSTDEEQDEGGEPEPSNPDEITPQQIDQLYDRCICRGQCQNLTVDMREFGHLDAEKFKILERSVAVGETDAREALERRIKELTDELLDERNDGMDLTPDDLAAIEAKAKKELGFFSPRPDVPRPDVQRVFSGRRQPKELQEMQTELRRNSRGRNDGMERTELTESERSSTGWALLPLIDQYNGCDRGEMNNDVTQFQFQTEYLFEEEDEDDLLQRKNEGRGSQQSGGRDERVLQYVGGIWQDANGDDVNSTGVGALPQPENARKTKLKKKKAEWYPKWQALPAGEEKDLLWKKLIKLETEKLPISKIREHKSVSGNYIFVMNAAGQFFAAENEEWVLHHSSFLAGGAVAGAGEVRLEGGTLARISNLSGHYKPGPAYLWQAVKQLELLGCPLENVDVAVVGVKSRFRSAQLFLDAMDPSSDQRWFDSAWAIEHLDEAEKGKRPQVVEE